MYIFKLHGKNSMSLADCSDESSNVSLESRQAVEDGQDVWVSSSRMCSDKKSQWSHDHFLFLTNFLYGKGKSVHTIKYASVFKETR